MEADSMSLDRLTIRKMKPADANAIARIHAEIEQSQNVDEYQKIAEEHTVRNRDASFVAELDGEVLGYMIGYILPGGFGMKKSAWIAMLGVRPKYMGQGIGEQLANAIFEHSKREGIHTIYTSVRWESPDLLSFFKRLGFEKSNFINLLKRI